MRLLQNPLGRWEHRKLMSHGSFPATFWDFTLVWKFWVFEEGSGEQFGCNTGKSKKLGKMGVKVRFGCKSDLKNTNFTKKLKYFRIWGCSKISLGENTEVWSREWATEADFEITPYFEKFECMKRGLGSDLVAILVKARNCGKSRWKSDLFPKSVRF